jgi:molybdopterin synthase catalytic subunit/molybdopterin converting factor small subunit
MRVRVRLFAVLRERAGRAEVELDLPDGAVAGDALAALAGNDDLGELATDMPVGFAVNRQYGDRNAPLADGDELALIPPVSGGAPTPHARVTGEDLDSAHVTGLVQSPGAGAIVTFCGTTRDVPRLEYEAYAAMAEERMRTILADAIERHGLEGAAAEHRIGSVPLGEPSVVVAVAAAHRQEAFAAAREVIDRIKAEAPIWKRELAGDIGDEPAEWVSGTLPPGSN